VVLVNARDRVTRVTVPGFRLDGARDLLTSRVIRGAALTLPAYGAVVLTRSR
jgi:hypothetical protein